MTDDVRRRLFVALRWSLHHKGSSVLNQLRGAPPRRINRKNPVGIAVNDQRGHVDAGQVFAEVLFSALRYSKAKKGVNSHLAQHMRGPSSLWQKSFAGREP